MPNLLAIGLPEAGKTTFLAALWHVTEREEVPGSLRLEEISENAKHLNSIKNDWLSFTKVVRTVPGLEQSATLWLRDEAGTLGEIVFPDLSGESFQGAWEERHWTKEYDELVASAGALLLFVHPGTLKEPGHQGKCKRLLRLRFLKQLLKGSLRRQSTTTRRHPKRLKNGTPRKLRRKCNTWICCNS